MPHRAPILGLFSLLIIAAAPDPASSAFTDADLQHLFNLGTGISGASKQSAQAEVDRIAVAFAQDKPDVKIRQYACLAVEKLAPLLNAEQSAALAPSVIPCITSSDGDTREYAMRAARQLAPLLPEKSIAMVSEISLKFLASEAPDDNRRGALLVETLAPKLPAKDLETSIDALVTAIDKATPATADEDKTVTDARKVAKEIEIRGLASTAAFVRDEKLAARLADRLLPVAGAPNHNYTGTHPQIALARLYTLVDEKNKAKILAAVLDNLANPDQLYSRTSGVYTPMRHVGADALLLLIPNLNKTDRETTRTRIPEARARLEKTGFANSPDSDNIFPPLLKALDAKQAP